MKTFKDKLIEQYLEETKKDNSTSIFGARCSGTDIQYNEVSIKDDDSIDFKSNNIEITELMGWFLEKVNNINDKIKISEPQTCNKLRDKQLIWAWDNSDKFIRLLCFYDAENDCIFNDDGHRGYIGYGNYLPYEGEYPQWAKDALLELDN